MGIKITSPHGGDISKAIAEFPKIVSKNMASGISKSADILLRELKSSSSIGATGKLKESWSKEIAITDAGTAIGEVGSDVDQAVYVEFGTRPHWAPLSPILNWVVGGPIGATGEEAESIAHAVQAKIAAKGTRGQYTLINAYTKVLDEMTKEINMAVGLSLKEIANGR